MKLTEGNEFTAVDSDAGWLYRTGGISALSQGIAYVVIIVLYVRIGAPPGGVEARLTYLARNTTAWWAILGLSVLTDFLFVPVALSLYVALKEVNRNAMLLATACVALFIVLDLAITWTNYAALITLSGQYAKPASQAQKAAAIAAAGYPFAVLQSSLLFVYNTLVLAVGILITGFIIARWNLRQTRRLFGLGHRHARGCFRCGALFCKCSEFNHNPHFCSHHSLGIACGLQTLQARAEVNRTFRIAPGRTPVAYRWARKANAESYNSISVFGNARTAA